MAVGYAAVALRHLASWDPRLYPVELEATPHSLLDRIVGMGGRVQSHDECSGLLAGALPGIPADGGEATEVGIAAGETGEGSLARLVCGQVEVLVLDVVD
jgi:hypothetical protein